MKIITENQHDQFRGRPRSIEKHTSILKAASDLFMEKGFDGTSMDEVARYAGVSKQTVYSHFSNKEQLFTASIGRVIDDYFPDYGFYCAENVSFEDRLYYLCEQFTRLLISHDAVSMFRLLASAASQGDDHRLAELFWASGPEEMVNNIRLFIEQGVAAKIIKVSDAYEAAIVLVSLIEGEFQFKLAIGLDVDISEENIKRHALRCQQSFMKLYT